MDTSQITKFDFHGANVRVLTDENGEPWFVGKEVANILGYANTRDALNKHVDNEDKNTVAIRDGKGNPNQTLINESGLYSLTLSSKLPTARQFKRWVTSEVLPQIRRTGGYIPVDETDDEKLILAKAVGIFQRTVREKDTIIEAQRSELETVKPLAMLGEAFVSADGTMSVTQAARHFQTIDRTMSRDTVYGILRGAGYIESKGSSPTMKAIRPGYLVPKQYVKDGRQIGKPYPRFTTKGLNWFINRYIYGSSQPALEGMGK